jgi:hypothetical protein
LRIACSSVFSASVRSAIEILLALGLFLELVDRGEIHLAEALDPAGHVGEVLLPGAHRGFGYEAQQHGVELESRGGELLEQRLAANTRLLGGQRGGTDGVPCILDARLG